MSSTIALADAEGFASAQARRTQVTIAGYAGHEAPVRAGLVDHDPTVRAAALSALERLGTLTSVDVASALDDTDLRVRRRACELATIIPVTSEASPQIDAILLRYLQTGDETMAELGAWSLGERHQQQSVDSQEAALRIPPEGSLPTGKPDWEPHTGLAGPISAALRVPPGGSLPTGKPDWEPHTGLAGPISAALRVPPGGSLPTGKPDWEPQGEGLGTGPSPEQGVDIPAAENRTMPENQTVVGNRTLAENQILAEIVRALAETVYRHPDALVREASVAALGCIGTDEAKAPILHALADKATVRRRAVIALSAFEGDDVEAALAQASGDRDWQVRQAAEDLMS
jgi:HEAT repeats